jgi:hypothetical protein
MISGKNFPRLAIALLLVWGDLRADDLSLETLLASVARPADEVAPFVEVRYSGLLKSPLVVSGQLEHTADRSLVRRILKPYREVTVVTGQNVVVEREGAKTRHFSLDRAPELQGLLSSISAMLRGDGEMLGKYFTPQLDGTIDAWHLQLVPIDPKLRQRISGIAVHGGTNGPRCFVMLEPDGDAGFIAIGTTTTQNLPTSQRGELENWCRTH